MQIINIQTSVLKPYDKNAKKHSKEQIGAVAESIKQFGFVQPVVIDKDKTIVIGHCRVLAAKRLKMAEVPCVLVDELTPEQVNALRLADNKTNESAWDIGLLNDSMVDVGDIDMTVFGFDLGEEQAVEDDYEPELPEEPKSKLGDLYQLGRHRLLVGDSTILDDVEKLMGDQKADLFLTDPPYNVALGMGGSNDDARKRHRRTDGLVIMNDKMENNEFRQFLTTVFSNAKMVMKGGAAFYIWHADSEGYNFRGAMMDAGFQIRQTLIWKKQSITLGRQDYQWIHEPCLYGWNDGSHAWYSDRKQSTVLCFDRPTKSELHPTMKPIPLFDYQIQNSSKAGDNVLDLFGGSGTSIIAAEQNGRTCYMMELDPRYIDVIIDRWQKFTGETAVLVDTCDNL